MRYYDQGDLRIECLDVSFQPDDRRQVEEVGWFVQEKEVRRLAKRTCQTAASLPASG